MPVITGTAGADTLRGSGDNDTIVAGAGDDVILAAGLGANSILAGDGNDRIEWGGASSFPRFSVDGGQGTDTLDFSSFSGGSYFFSRSITLRDGAQPNTIEGWVEGYERILPPDTPTLPKVFMDATGIERILGGQGVVIALGGFTTALEIHGYGGGMITTGSGDDLIALGVWQSPFGIGTVTGKFTVDAGPGRDTLRLEGSAADYLFVPTASGFTVYDGPGAFHVIQNVEQIQFGSGPAMTLADAQRLDFDAGGYLARYADLRAALGADEGKAYQHWHQFGKAEGRIAAFDGLAYIASYGDLRAALGPNAAAGLQHYSQYGAAEGRSILFNPIEYAAANLDLARIFGANSDQASLHYIAWGAAEGRATAGFDATAYLLSNGDLGGMTPLQARDHWLAFGAGEGRSGDALFGREQTSHVGFSGNTRFGETQSIASTFETATDRDWFEIGLWTQLNYTLDGSANVTRLQIFDRTGRLVAEDLDGQNFSFKLPVTGDTGPRQLYLVVHGSGPGAYSIESTLLGAPADPDGSDAYHSATIGIDGLPSQEPLTTGIGTGSPGSDWIVA